MSKAITQGVGNFRPQDSSKRVPLNRLKSKIKYFIIMNPNRTMKTMCLIHSDLSFLHGNSFGSIYNLVYVDI